MATHVPENNSDSERDLPGKNQASGRYGATESPVDGPRRSGHRYWPLTRLSLLEGLQGATPDPEAWERFVNLYGPLICEFCRKRTSEQDAMEITQEVFWRVFRYVKGLNYDPKLGSFGGWIGQITRNEIRHHIERRHRDSRGRLDESVLQSIEATATLGEWEDEYNAWVVRRAMQQVRDEVSECTWNLFAMTTSGATPQEAAEQMNVKISRVYKARWMIAERLRRLIRSMADDYPFAKQE